MKTNYSFQGFFLSLLATIAVLTATMMVLTGLQELFNFLIQ